MQAFMSMDAISTKLGSFSCTGVGVTIFRLLSVSISFCSMPKSAKLTEKFELSEPVFLTLVVKAEPVLRASAAALFTNGIRWKRRYR